jgi:hypothetical protein
MMEKTLRFPASPICTIPSGVTVIDVNSLNNAWIEIKRNYAMHAKEIISPDMSKCELIMDNMDHLQKFLSPDNSTAIFKYAESSELLTSKFVSDCRTYIYFYNKMGRETI